MKTVKQYAVAIVMTIMFVAGAAYAVTYDTAYRQTEQVSEVVTECTGGLCCDTAGNSFVSGSIHCDGKTGWDMMVEQVRNIR